MTTDTFNSAFKKARVVLLTEKITEDLIPKVRSQLFEYAIADSKKDVYLIIDSSGGGLRSACSIYDIIRALKVPVTGIVLSKCLSSSLIVLAGCKKRLSLPHARFGFHAISFFPVFKSTCNSLEATNIILKERDETFSCVQSIFNRHYNISKKKMDELNRIGELFDLDLSAQAAKDLAIINRIIETLPFDLQL